MAFVGVLPAGPCPSYVETSELNVALQVGSQQSGVEGQNPLSSCSRHVAFAAAHDMVGSLGSAVMSGN